VKIFLTGGTGLLGSTFVQVVIPKGANIVSLVRPASDTAYLESLGATLSIGDLRCVSSLVKGMTGCDVVVHVASPKGGWKRPEVYEENTVQGTRNIITAMKTGSVKTLIHVSTISIHGLDPIEGSPISEASGFGTRFLPYDHYGRAKVRAEKIVERARDSDHIRATILRAGWLYGPRDESSYGRLADRMRQGLLCRIGNGENRIPLAYAGNVARVLWRAITEFPEYSVYLYACDGEVTQNDYLESLGRATATFGKLISVPKGPLLVLAALQEHLAAMSGYRIPSPITRYFIHLFGSDWCFDQRRTAKELCGLPQVSYRKGFEATEAWYRNARSIS
jgi:nucleoside-diphosphate-sugar epimerase